MVFSDPSFLFLFLPLVFIGYFAVPRQLKNPVLLASSLLFYAWEEKLFVLVMLGSILFNYGVGIAVDRWHGHASGRTIFTLGIVGNLLALAIFKYANFLVENLNVALVALGISPVHMSHVHLPIGISFFTFQAMSYLIDLRRRDVSVQRNLLDFALYKSLFPQLIAGPVVRYGTVEHEIHLRRVSVEDFAAGVQHFVIGLAKKTMIANGAGLRADMIFTLPAAELTTPIAWLGSSVTRCRSTLIFPVIRIWRSAWEGCSASIFWRTFVILILLGRLPISGDGGIFPCQAGSATTSTFHSAVIASLVFEPISTLL